MRHWLFLTGRVVITTLLVLVAILVAVWLWIHYEIEPWTRDGRIRADVSQVAPDVQGLVTELRVHDNQIVRRGQILFVIDKPRYTAALEQADAAVARDQATLIEARREAARNRILGVLVSEETREQAVTRVEASQAALAQSIANRDTARLNLQRTTVLAPVNGIITNFQLRPGDYLAAGRQALALVDTDSLRVEGYFEETKLPRIHLGDHATIHIMGEAGLIDGHVESISAGIVDRDRSTGVTLLPDVNPTFSWVRLAQRVPVRIALDRVPPDIRLISGRTASVTIIDPHARPAPWQRGFWDIAW